MAKLTGVPLNDPYPEHVICSVLEKCGIPSAEVTSVNRTPLHQAEVMYDNLNVPPLAKSIARYTKLYRAPGKQVVKVFADNRTKPKAEVVALMTAKIEELMKLGQKVSNHISMPDDKCWVQDLGPNSIDKDKHASFVSTLKADQRVHQVLEPSDGDPAFHIEIFKEALNETS